MVKNNNTLIIGMIVILVLLLGVFGFGGYGMMGGFGNGYGMMGGLYGSYGYGMMFFSWIISILIIGLIIAAIYWLIKTGNKK